jgi:hypothetical protein
MLVNSIGVWPIDLYKQVPGGEAGCRHAHRGGARVVVTVIGAEPRPADALGVGGQWHARGAHDAARPRSFLRRGLWRRHEGQRGRHRCVRHLRRHRAGDGAW